MQMSRWQLHLRGVCMRVKVQINMHCHNSAARSTSLCLLIHKSIMLVDAASVFLRLYMCQANERGRNLPLRNVITARETREP